MDIEYERCSRFGDDESEDSYKVPSQVWDKLRKGYASLSSDGFATFIYDNLRPMIYDCAFNPDDFAAAFIQGLRNAYDGFEVPKRANAWELPESDPKRLPFLQGITVLVDLFSSFASSTVFLTKVSDVLVQLSGDYHGNKNRAGRPISTQAEGAAAYDLRQQGLSWGQITVQLRNTNDRKQVDQLRLATTRYAKRNKLPLPSPSDEIA